MYAVRALPTRAGLVLYVALLQSLGTRSADPQYEGRILKPSGTIGSERGIELEVSQIVTQSHRSSTNMRIALHLMLSLLFPCYHS